MKHPFSGRSTGQSNWRHAIMAGFAALILAALTAARIATHNVAHVGEQHHATALSGQLGTGNLAIDSTDPMTAPRSAGQENAIVLAATFVVNGVTFSRDGKMLANAYGDGLRIWTKTTGQYGGLGSGGSLMIGKGAIAIAVSARAMIITRRETSLVSRPPH